MSVSPQPASATITSHVQIPSASPFINHNSVTSPPLQSPSGSASAQSNAQLAQLLSASYRESEGLRKDLATTRKRLEKAERLLASYSAAAASALGSSPPNTNNGNGNSPTHPISEQVHRVIAECEARADRAEHARDEADARRRVLTEAWEELNRYLQVIEIRAVDARAGFARLVAEGGGQLVLTPIPILGQQQPVHTPSAPSPAIMLVPPSTSHHRSHRHSNSLHGISALPPPPNPTPSRVRPRSGSFDDPSYLGAPVQPPAKRSRHDREYDHRSHLSHVRGRPLDIDTHPGSQRSHLPSPHLTLQPHPAATQHPNSHSHSRSSSRSSQRSLSIDEMLLEASGEPQSPRSVIAHHQHAQHSQHSQPLSNPRGLVGHVSTLPIGPLDQPGEQRTYQTHIFAPPVTGAPTKKGKPGSGGFVNGPPALPTPPSTSSAAPPPQTPTAPLPQSAPSSVAPAVPHHVSYPPTNNIGQRICRQCGLAGRYKDGKCVEKWGPGPEGPGTVCDRCRKKMKRVERRGTMESQNQSQSHINQQANQGIIGVLAHAHSMPVHGSRVTRTDTVPANVGVGPGGTQLIGHPSQMNTHSFVSKDRRDRDRGERNDRGQMSSLAPAPTHPSRSGDSQRERTREPPSPPAIATLQTEEEEPHRRGSADRVRRPISSGKIH
ncbi:hypothetical protein PAXRUDRAFT_214371 [Paxillus rubicundulus Ve08.2h10]|uniref:Uncharacterized protein n=1 Tax=Paxillus rubicundulus Ve08.2h10 TaxID=930991 RepID=A0A0D0EBF5_9AGAM|nr:hypothetical protein PAXRUDRAFT_214371 [Paxillus rubicundulus Ve08.2h10]